MAENEITYIPYGQDEISQQDLMTSLANGVEGYLGSKRWAKKDKYRQAWLNAYQDIINHGLTGASNESGIWTVNHGQDPIDLNNKSNTEREMYQDAAYYIQQKMAQMTPRKKEEEKKKEDLEKYGSFGTNLMNRILKRYGNNSELFKDSEQGWDAQDVRGANGLRGTEKRRAAMIAELEAYKKDLDNQDLNYNFEGTSFKDKADLQTKIQTAIDALKNTPNDESDDLPAFNALGIPYRAFFNNGGNDIYGTTEDGKQVTYKQYYENQQKAAQEKAVAEAKAKKQAVYNNTLFINRVTSSKMLGQNAQALKAKYGDHNSLFAALQGYSQKDIRTLSPEEQSEVQGIYRYLAKDPIDNNLLKQLQGSSSGLYKNSAPNRFRKIKGIDNLIWDSVAGQVIQINNRQQQQALQNQPTDLFKGIQTQQDKEKEYLNSKIPGITNAEWKELSAIGLDIASIINPEAITGSGMALGAAALRHSAKNDSNPDWSLGDYFWQGVDYLTGALGGIQVAGDLVLGAKTMATASKAVPILRKMARFGAWNDLFGQIPDLAEATRKITSGEELTVKDWRAIGQGIRGLVSHGRLNRGNRAERRVLEKSGQNVTPENISSLKGKVQNYSQKLGFTRTKPTNTSEVSTVKATVNGKESEIEISSNAKARIQEKVQKAGNNTEARNKAVKEVLESEGKIKASDKIEVEAPTYRDGKYAPGWLGTSRNLFGTKQVSSQQGNDVFNDYISGNRSYWERYKYGSNTELKGIYNRLNINNNPLNNNQSSKSSTKTTETKSNDQKALPFHTNKKVDIERIRKYQENFKNGKGADSSEDLNFNIDEVTGSVNLGKGNSLNYFKQDNGKYRAVWVIEGKQYSKNFNNIKELKERMAKLANDLSLGQYGKINHKEVAKALRNMEAFKLIKASKYGGTLNPYVDNVIEDFLKNNNI